MPKVPVTVLAEIEKLLIAEIPRAIKSAAIKEQLYCIRVWYNGTDSDENAIPWLMAVKESTRKQLLAKHGAEHGPFYVWGADEISYPKQAYEIYLKSDRLQPLYAKWYKYLCDAEDDDELTHFREMVQRVCHDLNDVEWSELAPVTDDFIIFPADGSHTFCDDLGDMVASIPEDRLALLQSRNLIPSMDEQEFEDEDFDDDDFE